MLKFYKIKCAAFGKGCFYKKRTIEAMTSSSKQLEENEVAITLPLESKF